MISSHLLKPQIVNKGQASCSKVVFLYIMDSTDFGVLLFAHSLVGLGVKELFCFLGLGGLLNWAFVCFFEKQLKFGCIRGRY